MGEVIHVDFQKRVRKEKPKEDAHDDVKQDESNGSSSSSTDDEETQRIQKVESEFAEAMMYSEARRMLSKGEIRKIRTLPISPEPLRQAEELVRSYHLIQLMELLRNSKEEDWQRKPSFFTALINELEFRLQRKMGGKR